MGKLTAGAVLVVTPLGLDERLTVWCCSGGKEDTHLVDFITVTVDMVGARSGV